MLQSLDEKSHRKYNGFIEFVVSIDKKISTFFGSIF